MDHSHPNVADPRAVFWTLQTVELWNRGADRPCLTG
jgi:hypothetical protein